MADDLLWIDSVRCVDAIARLREVAPREPMIPAPAVGDAASDDVLAILTALVDLSHRGVAGTLGAMADDATMTALAVIDSDW